MPGSKNSATEIVIINHQGMQLFHWARNVPEASAARERDYLDFSTSPDRVFRASPNVEQKHLHF